MKNNFPKDVRFLLLVENEFECAWCGKNHANCLHHIFGRGYSEGCEKSAFNASPLNNFECHLPNEGKLSKPENKGKLLINTIETLKNFGYNIKEIDKKFFRKYFDEIKQAGINANRIKRL